MPVQGLRHEDTQKLRLSREEVQKLCGFAGTAARELFVVPQITDECNLCCQRYGDHLEVEFLGSASSDRSPLRAEL